MDSITKNSDTLKQSSRKISQNPYDASHFVERAQIFSSMGLTSCSIRDMKKAIILSAKPNGELPKWSIFGSYFFVCEQ